MIAYLDLQHINAPYEAIFKTKFDEFLKKGWYILGNEVAEFENAFASFCKLPYAVGVGNGLDALTLIFKGYIALGKLKKGDEVIVPANTYIASILAVIQADLVPVFVEPNIESYTLDVDKIESKITNKTKAILPVHLYGQLADLHQIFEIAHRYNLLVIEDAAQSHGAELTFPLNQSINRAVAYSFYPTKNLGALGDGGAVVSNDLELTNTIRLLRNYGSKQKYYNEIQGVNSRLDDLQAAFLNVKLKDLEANNQIRKSIAKRYLNEISKPKIILPTWDFSNNHVFHVFAIRTENREEFQNYLLENGIETLIHYPIPPHQQLALREYHHLELPITEQIHREILSIPLHPFLTNFEVSTIISVINRY